MPAPGKTHSKASLAILAIALALLACSCARAPAGPTAAPTPSSITVEEIHRLAKDSTAKAVLVNVWATWCAPCREELPALVKLQHALGKDGLELILVSADFDVPMDKLTAFLTSQGIDFQTYIKTEEDAVFKKAMSPDWSGAIPATFVYTGDGELVDFWEGKATYEAFEAKAREAMEQAPAGPQGG